MNLSRLLAAPVQWGFLLYFLLLQLTHLALILRAFATTRRYQDEVETDRLDTAFETSHSKPMTLVCPVHNEEAGVVASVNSLISLRYPEFQVVVVNDGSTDATLARLVEAFRLRPSHRVLRQLLPTREVHGIYESAYVPNLVVVDKVNGGKADALNCGINLARYPLVCCMDGDSLLENDALLRIARPFMDRPGLVASGGVIRPLNGCRVTTMGIRGIHLPDSWLARFQIVEYLRAFLFGRVGLASLDSVFIVSGAFGVFRKDLVVRAGGFDPGTVGEDFELVVRLHRRMREWGQPYHLTLVPDPICWTEVPEDFRTLGRQRNRWQRGLWEALWKHRRMWFNPAYGRVGLFSMPYFLLFEALAPVIEACGYLVFAWSVWRHSINTPFAVLFLYVALLLGVLNSVVSVLLQEISGHRYQGLRAFGLLLVAAVAENFGYRQLTLWWRLRGTFDWLRGKGGWGHMRRRGLGRAVPPA
ncbi:glycosyl transferase family 2 [Geothrix rubra]|uniref:Glycosyl transferase family 2 n=1 Tax=Geothrix rubra TaxID=2927977 RepID=A0ABQ5Q808_9BACT|nr:glycosyltransferase [Geothrix rubra]GLH70558.1 glycosyl transferase family 2 [Geothrix rubra]